jgi:hypothetical protein
MTSGSPTGQELAIPSGMCPVCGAATAPGQEYCLECGERLTGPAIVSGATVGHVLPIARASWFWPAVVGLLVVGIGVVAALFLVDKPNHTKTFIATAANTFITFSSPVATTAPVLPGTSIQPEPATTARPGVVGSWPAGRSSGYTVVLVSLPRTGGRRQALAIAREALSGGLADVGIIDSGRFASLHPGYFVVFSGVFESESAAAAGLSAARAHGFSAAYVRQVTR